VFADLLLDEVGDPVEGIGLHHRRTATCSSISKIWRMGVLSLSSEAGARNVSATTFNAVHFLPVIFGCVIRTVISRRTLQA